MSETINLEIELYQQNIGMLGMQGTGKTHFARKFLDMYPHVPRLIISPQKAMKHFGEYGYEINKISEIDNDRAMIWTGDFTQATFNQICNRISNEISDMMFVVDDCHEFCTKQHISNEWERVIQSKRNDGIFGVYLSPAPNRINPTILQSLKHIFAFRMQSYSQVEWLAKNYFHNDAWLLLEKKLRKQEPDIHPEINYLAKGSYIYKGWTDTKTQVYLSPFQDEVEKDDEVTQEEPKEEIVENSETDLTVDTIDVKTNPIPIDEKVEGEE